MAGPFFILARDAGGVHIVIAVSDAPGAEAAWQRAIGHGLKLIGINEDQRAADDVARQLNAANGIITGGCAGCG